ncbi:MAG: serine/threonine protein kinase [Leptolyngbyaceae cyanobacterium RU_5_1]|nr:serine/threonine protein kinase [Leptolyngbyaceae cyanobacterium RU_5_1]
MAAGILQTRTLRPLRRFGVAAAIALIWGSLSYIVFVQERLVLPTAVPMLAIFFSGSSYLFTGVVSEKLKLKRAVKKFASSPAVQELVSVSQQSDLQPLIEEHHQEIIGRKLGGRYVIVRDLASGGFGKTYIAEDTLRPGNPLCVVKRLRPASNNPKVLRLAQELFDREAKTLEKLGRHNQIPQLLAYINEDEEFYLVQEYVEGKALIDELSLGNLLGRLPERRVVEILQELLQILEFVHQQGVIHRDIKPGNIIRRYSDNKLVLIDFGAVKQLKQLVETETEAVATKLTVAIGTDGFMAPEQADGKPCFGSDIYSVGITGIQALTGISASKLKDKRDSRTAELMWKENAQVSHTLAEILDKMVCYNFAERYKSATAALEALSPLADYAQQSLLLDDVLNIQHASADVEDSVVEETRPWPETFS